MTERRFDARIENIRAFAILAVVFGHSIILYSSSLGIYQAGLRCAAFDYIKRFINLFQMPLFFFLSGYLFSKNAPREKTLYRFWLKKLKRLIVPFFIIGAGWMIPLKLLLSYPGYLECGYFGALGKLLSGADSGHLWYLPTLFAMFVLFSLAGKLDKANRYMLPAVAVLMVLSFLHPRIPDFNIPFLQRVYQHAWAFALGMSLPELEKRYDLHSSKLITYIAAPLSILLGIADSVILNREDVVCAAALVLAIYFLAPRKTSGALSAIGKNSFGIYLFHSPLIYITFTYFSGASPALVAAINFLIFGALSYFMTELARRLRLGVVIGE